MGRLLSFLLLLLIRYNIISYFNHLVTNFDAPRKRNFGNSVVECKPRAFIKKSWLLNGS